MTSQYEDVTLTTRMLFHVTGLGGLVAYLFTTFLLFSVGLYHLGWQLGVGLVLILCVAVPCKLIFFKHRPQKMKYSNLLGKFDAAAFPSIHAMRAVMIGLIVGSATTNPLVWTGAGLFALVVSYSRIYLRKHSLNDVIGGVIFSFLLFLIVQRII